ncbi:MAG: hypothetical protein KME30_26825 [Iphinoe sp. HA4291-MV1]|nr:hypothetical protein [Iphinoe sp. HA4291-MV1]
MGSVHFENLCSFLAADKDLLLFENLRSRFVRLLAESGHTPVIVSIGMIGID